MNIEKELEKAKTTAEIFGLVKEIVKRYLKLEQAGLLVGISDLGMSREGFVGAFYSLNANIIIINKRPLKRLIERNPALYKYYIFHVMLHEYIHAIGSYDESQTRQLTYEISNHYFGLEHPVTLLAASISRFMQNLAYASSDFELPYNANIEFLEGIDRENTNYIN